MTNRLILLADSETDATRVAAFPRDERLTDRGRAAAAHRRSSLPRFDRVLRSPARAAQDMAEALGQDAEIEPALADIDYGHWRGHKLKDIAGRDPHFITAWLTDPSFLGHGGESLNGARHRVGHWLKAQLLLPSATLALTHAAIVRCAVLVTLDAPASAFWRVEAPPLSFAELSSDGRRWTLRQLGRPPE